MSLSLRRTSGNSVSSMSSSTSSASSSVILKSPEQQQQRHAISPPVSLSTSSFREQHKQYDTIPTRHRVIENGKPLSMKGHLAKSKLPFWVRLVQGNLQKHLHLLDPLLVRGLDCAIPLQVLEIRRRKLIIARKMQWDRKSQDYVVTGKHLQIPIHFKGWFEVIPDDGRPVEYFDTIQGITAIKPKKFLVRTSTVGYELGEENGVSSWIPREISPGEVLTTGMVYMDHRKTRLTTNMKNLFKKILKYGHIGTKRDEDLKYLQCFDGKGNEIMIPLIMTGVFSPIGDPKNKSYDAVYELKDLTLAFDLPVKAQLIYANSHQKYHVPHGVLKLDSVSEDDCVVVSKGFDRQDCFELPLDEDLCYVKDVAPKSFPIQNLAVRSRSLPNYSPKTLNEADDITKSTTEIDLPVRVPSKDSKKQKSPGIIERLSTRKTKKERAALKALQEEGIFSSRLSKAEMAFDAFYTDGNYFENSNSAKDRNQQYQGKTLTASSKSTSSATLTRSDSTPRPTPLPAKEYPVIDPFEDQYAKVCKKTPLHKRDLPPVPSETKDDSETGTLVDADEKLSLSSNDTLYEHLPAAPIPPASPANIPKSSESSYGTRNDSTVTVDSEEDGYMIPSQVNKKKEYYRRCSANQVPTRRPVDNWLQNSHTDLATYANCKEPVNHYRPYTNGNRSSSRATPDSKMTAASTSDLSRLDMPSSARTTHFVRRNSTATDCYVDRNRTLRNLDGYNPPPLKYNITDSRDSIYPSSEYSTEFQKKARNTDPNHTWRRHNMRRLKNAMEVFHFTDSFREVRPVSSHDSECLSELGTHRSAYNINGYNTSPHGHCATPNHFSSLGRNGYPESEPGSQCFVHSLSVSGLSDLCAKQGDDSAISLCSKGDYGFQGGSDYSYSEYADVFHEDGWLPPDNIDCLSVQEVSRSLRYIGMKDRVVKRFANEQIDGQMLASLDWQLLKDGFPELNTLEVKKIIDFINGWRPKKSMS